jgi:uncharacterized protein (DUF433 family)
MEGAERITIDEKVRFGNPLIWGTLVSIYLIIGKLAGGMTCEEVMAEYDLTRLDRLSEEEIRAVG